VSLQTNRVVALKARFPIFSFFLWVNGGGGFNIMLSLESDRGFTSLGEDFYFSETLLKSESAKGPATCKSGPANGITWSVLHHNGSNGNKNKILLCVPLVKFCFQQNF